MSRADLLYFVGSLGYDEYGKRIQHWGGRGFKSQIEAKKGYESYINDFYDSVLRKILLCHIKNFMKLTSNQTISNQLNLKHLKVGYLQWKFI
ncbi:Arm DNA-binding domain-containing protein [Veillonella sp. 3627]|uniref:Arm DNA-binding domain-containing protein n=1 Tax=Veillonella sp. 3627 TaxID=2490953 RepID=UPI00197FEFDE